MSDLISRQAVREALLKKGQSSKRYKLGETWELNWLEIEDALSCIPAIDAEPVKHAKDKLINELNTELSGYRQNAIVFKPELMYTLKECEPKLEEWHNENPTYQNLQEIRYRAAKAEYDKIMKVLNGWGIKTM